MTNYDFFTDDRGGFLIPISLSSIPFIPKRVFTVADIPKNSIRGHHAHYETEQVLVCVKGEIIVGIDDGKNKAEKKIKKGQSFYIKNLVWDWQKYLTGDDVMISFCSTEYDKSDYIENIEDFYNIVNK
jgi:dTDP-4-dehydrorhamnose 3,5-epimerase-like enzyme